MRMPFAPESSPVAQADDVARVQPTRSLRRVVALVLIGTAVASVLVAGLFQYVDARSLLTEAVEAQLANHQSAQVRAIREGLQRLQDQIAVIARGERTVAALRDFSAAYREVEASVPALEPAEFAALMDHYDQLVTEADTTLLGNVPPPEDLLPAAPAARFLQYRYVTDDGQARHNQDASSAQERTDYERVHAERHPGLDRLRTTLGFGDLLLVDDAGRVVYTADKRVDFATAVGDGPYRETVLAAALARLTRSTAGETALVDFEAYLPASGRPVMFASASVADGAAVIGAVVVGIPIDRLNALTTNGESWRASGLGDTGETYVVGPDRLMRSDARLWLEDPDAYLARLPDAGYPEDLANSVAAAGTTVLLQPVMTDAVDEAFDGEVFSGRTDSYLGQAHLTVAGSLGTSDLDWAVVAEKSLAEANEPLAALNRRLLLVLVLLVPAVAVVGVLLAEQIARPVQPVVDAAAAIADGKLETRVTPAGRNEVGDVGRRLNTFAEDLQVQRAVQQEEERELTLLLHSVLPERLVDQVRSGQVDVSHLADTATVVALTVHGPLEEGSLDPDTALDLSARLSGGLEAAAKRHGLERVRSASDRHLFAAGLGVADVAADRAAAFVTEVGRLLDRFSDDNGVAVHHHAGLCSGEVVAGLLHPDTLTYGVFGDPTRTAMALDSVASDGEVLVDPSTARELAGEWLLEPAEGLVDLRGEPVDGRLLRGKREHE